MDLEENLDSDEDENSIINDFLNDFFKFCTYIIFKDT